MPRIGPIRCVHALVLAIACALAVTTTAAAQDLESVRQQRRDLEARLEAATTRVERLRAEIATREQELEELTARGAELERTLEETQRALTVRARAAFKHGGGLRTLEALLSSRGPDEAFERASVLDVLARRDATTLEATTSLRTQLEQTEALRRDALADLEQLRADADAAAATLSDDLDRVRAHESDLQARAERQRRVADGAMNGTYACIFQGAHSFIDSWGFARSGGRRHKGTDVMAAHRAPVYAFTGGTLRVDTNRLGGVVLYLHGDDGNRYYYAHLDGFAAGIRGGARVEAGQLVAYNGNSGNARGGAPHVHFEVHPGGGSPVNPYPWLRTVCR